MMDLLKKNILFGILTLISLMFLINLNKFLFSFVAIFIFLFFILTSIYSMVQGIKFLLKWLKEKSKNNLILSMISFLPVITIVVGFIIILFDITYINLNILLFIGLILLITSINKTIIYFKKYLIEKNKQFLLLSIIGLIISKTIFLLIYLFMWDYLSIRFDNVYFFQYVNPLGLLISIISYTLSYLFFNRYLSNQNKKNLFVYIISTLLFISSYVYLFFYLINNYHMPFININFTIINIILFILLVLNPYILQFKKIKKFRFIKFIFILMVLIISFLILLIIFSYILTYNKGTNCVRDSDCKFFSTHCCPSCLESNGLVINKNYEKNFIFHKSIKCFHTIDCPMIDCLFITPKVYSKPYCNEQKKCSAIVDCKTTCLIYQNLKNDAEKLNILNKTINEKSFSMKENNLINSINFYEEWYKQSDCICD